MEESMDPNAAPRASAEKVIEAMETLITNGRYKAASNCIKMAMEVYPTADILKEHGVGLLIISETLHYGNIFLSKGDRTHLYSVLHLPPPSTQAQVLKRFKELQKEVFKIMTSFPGLNKELNKAEYLLIRANIILQYQTMCAELDRKRKDLPAAASNNKTTTTTTLPESYLNWKLPVYHVDATKDPVKPYYVFSKLRNLKRKAFDELPQNQHDNKKVCQDAIKNAKDIIANLKSKMEALKKDSSDAIAKSSSTTN